MNIDLFIENLQKPLPGLEIQMLMAPPVRSFDDKVPSNVRKGGVCILLFKKNEIWNFVLIKRTEDGGTHSGQISLPGGKFEEEDYSITYTSVREMEEEIGVAKSDIKILGLLTELYIPPSNFLVTPIVALLQNPPNFIASPEEVSEILEINIDDILNEKNKMTHPVFRSDNKNLEMQAPIYNIQDHKIWGATAMILRELEELVKKSK